MIRILLNDIIYNENYLNWNEVTDRIARSKEFKGGVIIVQTLEIQLIEAAYEAIKALDDQFDIAAVCTIQRQSFDQIDGWVTDFDGFVDFTDVKYDTNNTVVKNNADKTPVNTVTISAYDNNFSNKLLEFMDVSIPYDRLETLEGEAITPFTDEYVSVDIEGIEIISNNELTTYSYTTALASFLYIGIQNSSNLDLWKTTVYTGASFSPSEDEIESNKFFDSGNIKGNINGTISIKVDVRNQPIATWRIRNFNKVTGETLVVEDVGVPLGTGSSSTETVIKTLTFDYDFETDSRLLITFSYTDGNVDAFQDITTDINVLSIADDTPCNFVPPHEAAQRTIEAITGQANGITSPFFGRTDLGYDTDGDGALFFHTNGKLIRQFPTGYQTTDENKVSQLTFSLKDWFESLDKIFCLGAGVVYEDGQYKLYVDDRKEFYKNEVVISLSLDEIEIDTYERTRDLTHYYNEIEVGSDYTPPEEVSGLEEYMSKQNYSTPVIYKNKLDLANKVITAAYPFEFARRKPYSSEQTTDYKYDTNNFLFNVYRDGAGYVQHSAQDFDEILGLDNITNYINLNISPKRILQKRYGWLLNSGLKGYQGGVLKYNESEIVTDLSTRKTDEAEPIVENDDVVIGSLESPIFTGYKIKFTARISPDKFKALKANPYGLIEHPDLINGGMAYSFLGEEISTNLVDKTTNVDLIETTGFSEDGNFILTQDGGYILQEDGVSRILINN